MSETLYGNKGICADGTSINIAFKKTGYKWVVTDSLKCVFQWD